MRNRSMVFSALVLFALFVMASAAYAAAPPSTPAVMQSVTFETASPSDTLQVDTSLDPFIPQTPNPRTWGIVSGVQKSGTHGFWCAGSNNTGVVGLYPPGTRGQATLAVPDASQYYMSSIEYSYIMPTISAVEARAAFRPFIVNWASPLPTSGAGFYGDTLLPNTSTWTTITRERGGFGMPPLSAGYLRFQFLSDPNQGANTGQGVTIDDIKVLGYEFGPVNTLQAARKVGSLTDVAVTWQKPSARGTTTADPRTIYYRVWRKDVAANSWTELTTDAIAGLSFTDTGGADIAKQYQYAVQGYDSTTNTTQWGVLAASPVVDTAQPHFKGMAGNPLAVGFGGTTQISALLVDEVGSALSSQTVVVERRVGTQAWTETGFAVSEISTGTYSATVTSNVNASYRFKHAVAGTPPSAAVAVQATGYLTTPSTPSRVKRNKAFSVKGSANRVPGVTRYVVLKAYHKETKKIRGKKKTVWVYRASAKGALAPGDGVGTYSASLKVKLAGSWRVTASLADVYNPAKTSAIRGFSAK
jgi:hypothetical protein